MIVSNYTLVQAHNVPELITKVNALINMGWQPQGAPTFDAIRNVLIQAMVTSA